MRRRSTPLAAALLAALPALTTPAAAMSPDIGIDCADCQFPTAVRLPLCSGVGDLSARLGFLPVEASFETPQAVSSKNPRGWRR